MVFNALQMIFHRNLSQLSVLHCYSLLSLLKLFVIYFRERQEDKIFRELLRMCHGLEDRLLESSDGDLAHICDLVSGYFTLKTFAD